MSAMKEWSANGEVLSLQEIVDPLVDAFEQCYVYTRTKETVDFAYEGYDFGPAEKAAGASPVEALKAANFASSKGETPLRVILEVAVKLGIEQGRRFRLGKFLFQPHFNSSAAPVPGGLLRNWPVDSQETVSFEALTAPLERAVQHYYHLKRKNADRDVDYRGYNVGGSMLAGSPPPDERLTVGGLEHDRERGRSPADVIIGIAVQLGIEQGERLVQKDPQIVALKKRQEDELAEVKRERAAYAALPEAEKDRIRKLAADRLKEIMKPK